MARRARDYAQKWDHWGKWQALADRARNDGFDHLAAKHRPPANAGWETIEKCIHALEAELASKQLRMF